jgi:NAD(P)-dependent dehydrogenase (short-subunit alcohol dehydrogenase family)
MAAFSPSGTAGTRNVTHPAHFRGITATNEPTPSLPAVLKPMLLAGVGITTSGSVAPQIQRRLEELGASTGTDVLVHAADEPRDADGARAALDGAWDAIRAHMLPPGRTGGLIVLLSPPRDDPHAEAARAGLENLARTLSIEWARYAIRPVTIHQGPDPHATAELVAFLASRAGAYYAGCAFMLRRPTAPRRSPPSASRARRRTPPPQSPSG